MTRRSILTLAAVLAVTLGGLGYAAVARPWWLPEWARIPLGGQAVEAEDAGLYCKEHGVPEKFCTLCHEELKSKLLLCKEHGDIPEDICTLCHPEVEKAHKIEMCPKGHGLPKHFCVQCGTVPSAHLDHPDDGWCAAHSKPEVLCRECADLRDKGQPLPTSKVAGTGRVCKEPLPLVRLASASLAKQVGIKTVAVVEEEHAHRLVANAETAYDANHYADVTPRVSGFLREVKADLGQVVKQGDVICVIDSSEVSAAKTQFLTAQASLQLAQATADRTLALTKSGVVAAKAEIEVRTGLAQAQAAAMDGEQKLRNLGFDDAALLEIIKIKDTRNILTVVAPIAGTIVQRHAVRGEAVQATTQLFAVADTTRMWLWIDAYEADIAKLKPGQAVTFAVLGSNPGDTHEASGKVTWVGTEVNEQTRTTRVRAELGNDSGLLRANQYGEATILVGEPHKAVVVPKDAVQREDNVDVVFLPEAEGVYRPQRVVTKPTDRPDLVEVTWGLKPGQTVVGRGAFLLKTEIMKGSIGAGCCE